MDHIDAITFFGQFKQAMKETNIHDGETYLSKYKLLKNNKRDAFTKFINKEIIPEIIRCHDYSVSHEYFRIDASGWVSHHQDVEATAKAVGLKAHLWNLLIAVEHENDTKDWNDEVIKLAHVRCPLKVVIGYNACDNRDDGDYIKLAFVAECLQQLLCFNSDHKDEFLIILGNCKGTNRQDYDAFDYRGYIYDYDERAFGRIP
jgi:hypothetical protein